MLLICSEKKALPEPSIYQSLELELLGFVLKGVLVFSITLDNANCYFNVSH